MSMTSDIATALSQALEALKPRPIPMRNLPAHSENGLAVSVLTEVNQTVLLRLLTFVSSEGKRIVILAGDRRIYSLRSSEGGKVEDSAEGILAALNAFSGGQASTSVASAPPPDAVRPKTRGFLAEDLLDMLLRPADHEDEQDKDIVEVIRDRMSAVLVGSAIRTQRGRVMVPMDDTSRILGDHIKTVAGDVSTRHNFLDEAIPGPKLVIHSGWEPDDLGIAYTGTEEKTLLVSFKTEGLVQVMSTWQSLVKLEK